MYLLEHDAKALLAQYGVAVPRGVLLDHVASDSAGFPPGPWVVKAQLAVGGRGKAGLIRTAQSTDELQSNLRELLGASHQGMVVNTCRVETQVIGAGESYISFTLDPVAAGVRVMVAAQGGADIETLAATPGAVRNATVAPQLPALAAQVERLTVGYAPHIAHALNDAAGVLAKTFLEAELALLEINPLFVRPDGSWLAGDAKIVADENALYRQPRLRALVEDRAAAYIETQRKLQHGCDFVVVDPDGEIGLLTTGAGLSMMLIDELRAAGLKPYNFLDVRTSGLRGNPARLVSVLNWIAEGRRVRVLLVNIFAGITDLGEFAQLLLAAFERAPRLQVPVVARLIGTRLEAAREHLAVRNITVVTDLDVAIGQVQRHLESGAP